MSLFPGDRVGNFEIQRLVAYQGKADCESWQCTRVGIRERPDGSWDLGECRGWHCSLCDAPCSMMGHNCPRAHEVQS